MSTLDADRCPRARIMPDMQRACQRSVSSAGLFRCRRVEIAPLIAERAEQRGTAFTAKLIDHGEDRRRETCARTGCVLRPVAVER